MRESLAKPRKMTLRRMRLRVAKLRMSLLMWWSHRAKSCLCMLKRTWIRSSWVHASRTVEEVASKSKAAHLKQGQTTLLQWLTKHLVSATKSGRSRSNLTIQDSFRIWLRKINPKDDKAQGRVDKRQKSWSWKTSSQRLTYKNWLCSSMNHHQMRNIKRGREMILRTNRPMTPWKS